MTAQERFNERFLRAGGGPRVAEPVLAAAFVLGIDPGPSTGITLLTLDGAPRAFQCNALSAPWLLRMICEDLIARRPARGQVEGFAPGHGAGSVMRAGQVTRALVEELAGICGDYGIPLAVRYAAVAKAWATDRRLEAAGLLAITAKAPDARDGARHALFCSVHDCGWPDPLSRKRGGP